MRPTGINRLILILLLLAVLILFFADLLMGSSELTISDIFKVLAGNGTPHNDLIVFQFRMPKAFTALIAGSAMAVSGLLMQTLFRNPLAGPDVLGVSSGAGLGVALMLLTVSPLLSIPPDSIMYGWGLIIAAWIGAGAVMILIISISAHTRNVMTVLIIGILTASAISSLVTLLQYFSNETMLRTYVIWTMGNLGNLSYSHIRALSTVTLAGIASAMVMIKPLNAMLLGETFSRSVGVNVRKTRLILLASSSILAGSVTAFCGPLAFIGVAVPHIARLILRTSDHWFLVPGSALCGMIALLLSDMVSLLPGSGHIIPVNTVTSLIGIPVLLWIIAGKGYPGRI